MALTSTQIIRNYIDTIGSLERKNIQNDEQYEEIRQLKNIDIIRMNDMEDVVVAYADISITGTDRDKPQIRVFMDKIKTPYDFAKAKSMRFFAFSIFSKDKAMAKNIKNYDPHEYLVSLETNIDNDSSRRDIRSMYNFVDEYIGRNGETDYVRCAAGQHQSGVYQASFIRINDNGKNLSKSFLDYMTYFDSRPYMNSKTDYNENRDDNNKGELKYNRIIFGAPGTGKSHKLELDSKQFDERLERVTFHPNYSYASFVGTYKPTMMETPDWLVDNEKKKIIAVLQDKSMTAQEKYDLLYDKFKDEGLLTRLPLLLGIYTDEDFKTRKLDGTDAEGDNSVERNHGKAIRPYLNLKFQNSNKEISYEYVPGPFMRIYTQALNHPKEKFLLLIEEINRANVAAVFGDIFQLLDRKHGVSEYPIATSEDIKGYLLDNLDCLKGKNVEEFSDEEKEKYFEMRIPSNMYIWATMNSADQGVFPMDTAFKRRWEFEYIGVDDEEQVKEIENYIIPMCTENTYYVSWQELRKEINTILAENCKVNEDKLLGPFFISRDMLEKIKNNKVVKDKVKSGDISEVTLEDVHEKEKGFIKAFESKVIMYLFEDVMRMRPQNIFIGHEKNKGKMIFSKICEAFEKDGEKIFGFSEMQHIE
ncbi:MAG: hypothetical protein MSS92_08505 [Lachnospiraceae bacterium]|uniref:hypothetical protein n=1 Tax=Roseburia hominis TaxID=301301 RepID=UPI001F165E8A|nr:hypothetical protein [Roseburia hominis]MCI7596234.1 hypothetical protein [Lachnospiraceae bacterium]